MLARVSNLESFRRWREDEEATIEDLERYLTVDAPSEAMLAGTAFHAALETAPDGDHSELLANGFTFLLPDAEIALPTIRELRGFGRYGPLAVAGKVDCLLGRRVDDHKTTARFDAESYFAGYQWRFYLDLFEADVFRWNVFEINEVGPRVYEVRPPQIIEQRRYPGMHADCERLAREFFDVVSQRLPGYSAQLEEAA